MRNEEEIARRCQTAKDISRKFAALGVEIVGCGCCGAIEYAGVSWASFNLTVSEGKWDLDANYWDEEAQERIHVREVFTLSQG